MIKYSEWTSSTLQIAWPLPMLKNVIATASWHSGLPARVVPRHTQGSSPLAREPPEKRYRAYGAAMVMGSLEFPETDLSWFIPTFSRFCKQHPAGASGSIMKCPLDGQKWKVIEQWLTIQHFPVQPKSAVPSQQVCSVCIYLLASIANPMRLCFSERMHSAKHSRGQRYNMINMI